MIKKIITEKNRKNFVYRIEGYAHSYSDPIDKLEEVEKINRILDILEGLTEDKKKEVEKLIDSLLQIKYEDGIDEGVYQNDYCYGREG